MVPDSNPSHLSPLTARSLSLSLPCFLLSLSLSSPLLSSPLLSSPDGTRISDRARTWCAACLPACLHALVVGCTDDVTSRRVGGEREDIPGGMDLVSMCDGVNVFFISISFFFLFFLGFDSLAHSLVVCRFVLRVELRLIRDRERMIGRS